MTVIDFEEFRLRRALGRVGRALGRDQLPSDQFPYVVRRLLSGVHQIVLFEDIGEGDPFRRLQLLAQRDGVPFCLVLNAEQALYFEPGEPKNPGIFAPPRGGIWLNPVDWREDPLV